MMGIMGYTEDDSPCLRRGPHVFPPLRKKSPCFLFVYGLRIRDSGYLTFQNAAPCQRESARALPCNSAAANTIYGAILM